MRKLLTEATIALTLTTGTAMAEAYKGYEQPPYQVQKVEGDFELRSYGQHKVAEVQVQGSRDGAVNIGFRKLAGYIFGGNESGQKIAMTVPVAQTPSEGGSWIIRFMIPAEIAKGELPLPKDEAIRFVTLASERQVALKFSGLRGDGALEARAEDLRVWAKSQDLTITAGPHFYFYDGPMTLPWNRRNEVAFTVR